jgi:hypothetical protein
MEHGLTFLRRDRERLARTERAAFKSSPPGQEGVATASADGVVVFFKSQIRNPKSAIPNPKSQIE